MPDSPTPNHRRLLCRAVAASGLSQAEIARRIGTSQPTVAALLSGPRPITRDTLAKFADALDGRDTQAEVIARLEAVSLRLV